MAHRSCANISQIPISIHWHAHAFFSGTKSTCLNLLHGNRYCLFAFSIFVSLWLGKQAILQGQSTHCIRGLLVCKHMGDVSMEWMHLLNYTYSILFLYNLGISLEFTEHLARSVYMVSIHWYDFISDCFHLTSSQHFFQQLSGMWKPKPLINWIPL